MIVQSATPTESDVICGRGRRYDMLEGNRAFRRLIKKHATSYSNSISTSRKRKALIVKVIREQLSHRNVRFLKQNRDGTLHEMGDKEIKVKIGHALRDAKGVALPCNPSSSEESFSSKVFNPPCAVADNLTAPLGDHDRVAKQSDRGELPVPRHTDLLTIASTGSSDAPFPVTCQDRVERPLIPEQLDTAEEMLLMEFLLKSPPQTQQPLPEEVPSWPDTYEEDSISQMLTEELDNITRDNDFLKSMWDDEDF